MELTKAQIRKLEKHGWEAVSPMWIGSNWDSKTNLLQVVNNVIPLDQDVEGYDFVIVAMRKETGE